MDAEVQSDIPKPSLLLWPVVQSSFVEISPELQSATAVLAEPVASQK
jgi:hypothetical protein